MGESSAGCDKSAHRALYAVLAGLGLLSGGWVTATTSLAATCYGTSCDNVDRVLQGLDVSRDDLTVETVDLASGVPHAKASTPPGTLTESMAPLLYLTPRVTTILQDVFGDSEENVVVSAEQAPDLVNDSSTVTADDETRLPASPVADADNRSNLNLYDPISVLDNAANLPKFQRQMYRTDI